MNWQVVASAHMQDESWDGWGHTFGFPIIPEGAAVLSLPGKQPHVRVLGPEEAQLYQISHSREVFDIFIFRKTGLGASECWVSVPHS